MIKTILILFIITFSMILSPGKGRACTISTGSFNPGNYQPNQLSPVDGTGDITVTCANGVAYEIKLENGLNYLTPNRRMNSSGDYLSYQLYRDASRGLVWGSTFGVDTRGGTGNGTSQTYLFYSRIPGNQNIPEGTYGDSITITVEYY